MALPAKPQAADQARDAATPLAIRYSHPLAPDLHNLSPTESPRSGLAPAPARHDPSTHGRVEGADMVLPETPSQRLRRVLLLVPCALAVLLTLVPADGQSQQKVDVLRIGTSGSFSGEKSTEKEKSALG